MYVNTNSKQLARELKLAYQDAYLAGQAVTYKELGNVGVLAAGVRDVVGGINWSSWQPGSELASMKVRDGGLQRMLDKVDVTIQGIDETTMTQVGDILGAGLETGATWQEISANLQDVLDDPYRADMIATTETGRSFIQSSLDFYEENGVEQWNWVAYDGACDDCADGEDGSPYSIADEAPPIHPDCRCYVDAVITADVGSQLADDTEV